MMKRKEREIEEGETSAKKPKALASSEEIENNKAGDVWRVVKGLLRQEQTRLSGLLSNEFSCFTMAKLVKVYVSVKWKLQQKFVILC